VYEQLATLLQAASMTPSTLTTLIKVPDVILKIWLSPADKTTSPEGEIAQSPNSTFALIGDERKIETVVSASIKHAKFFKIRQ
jgi:hypothetical protein